MMRILVIEDNPGDVRLIEEMLEEAGEPCAVSTAATLGAGLERLREGEPDVVLLDPGLPDSTGLATLARIQAATLTAPVVVMSSADDMTLAVQAVGQGAEDYLVKGRIDPEILRRSLVYAVERKRMKLALRRSEEQYRQIVETISDGILVKDRHGIVVFTNPRLAQMLGSTPGEVSKRGLESFIDRQWLAAGRSAPQPGDMAPREVRFRRADDGELWALASAAAIPDGLGGQSGTLYLVADITELVRHRGNLEDLVQERTAELATLNRELAREVAARKLREVELRALSRRLFEAQEGERRTVARELHDEIGQMVTGLLCMLESARQSSPQAAATLGESQEVAKQLMAHVQDLTRTLRPPMLEELGLAAALRSHCKHFTGTTGVAVDFGCEGVPPNLPIDSAVAAYRVVQEALTNVARHAATDAARVRVWVDGSQLHVLVEDRGKGFDPGSVGGTSGLSGMRERVSLLDGSLRIDSSPGRGTRIEAGLPLSGASG